MTLQGLYVRFKVLTFYKVCPELLRPVQVFFPREQGQIPVGQRNYQCTVCEHRKDGRPFIHGRNIDMPFFERHHGSGDGRNCHYEPIHRHADNVEQERTEKQEAALSALRREQDQGRKNAAQANFGDQKPYSIGPPIKVTQAKA